MNTTHITPSAPAVSAVSLYCPRCSRLASGSGDKPRQWQPHRCLTCVSTFGHLAVKA